MAKAFPDHPFLRGYYAPLHMECDAAHLPVTGEIPKELCGTLYRNGPNPQFAPRGFYHWFAGDGMLHAFHVEDGRVSYRNRWVRTPKWELENKAGEALIGAFGNPMWTDQKHWGFDSTIANTNVVWHGDRLLALEEAHAPFEVDAKTLMPKGYRDWDGQVGRFTAHPKIDPRTGDMVAFAYSAAGRFTSEIDIIAVGADGTLKRKERFSAPYSSMIHDFVVTERWIILPVFPLTGSMERAMKGQPAFAWEPDKGTHVALIPRDGTVADVKWITGDACYVFHPLNAFDAEGGKIVCDMMKYPVAPLFPLPDGSMPTKHSPKATLVRWTFDPLRVTNAHLNVARLGVIVRTYHADYYGAMAGINAGLPSDRLLADWHLDAPAVAALARGERLLPPEEARRVVIPADIDGLLSTAPDHALAERLRVRAEITAGLNDGYVLTGFDRATPAYLMTRAAA